MIIQYNRTPTGHGRQDMRESYVTSEVVKNRLRKFQLTCFVYVVLYYISDLLMITLVIGVVF